METIFKTIDLKWPFFFPKTRVWLIIIAILFSIIPFNQTLVLIISTIMIGTIGLMHGATDHLLFISYRRLQQLKSIPKAFYLVYLSVLAGMGLVWFLLPQVAIGLFIIVSCYHFGQTQLQYLPASENNWKKKFIYFIWGATVLAFIILMNPKETLELLAPFQVNYLAERMIEWRILIISISVLAFLFAFLSLKKNANLPRTSLIFELIELIVLFWLALRGNLLLSFAVFFSLWHSLRAVQVQMNKLSQERKITTMSFIKESLPFTALSILGIAALFVFINFFELSVHPFMVVLIAISILTMPHMIIYERFYRFHDKD